MKLIIQIPCYNEVETLPETVGALPRQIDGIDKIEVMVVDDGSEDGSFQVLKSLYEGDGEHIRVIQFRRNFGKTAALTAGFRQARGDVVITMDADLQDNPAEIPDLLEKLVMFKQVLAQARTTPQGRLRCQHRKHACWYIAVRGDNQRTPFQATQKPFARVFRHPSMHERDRGLAVNRYTPPAHRVR